MPFTGKNTQDTIELVKKGILNTSIDGFKSLSLDGQKFITNLMNKVESKRMTAQ